MGTSKHLITSQAVLITLVSFDFCYVVYCRTSRSNNHKSKINDLNVCKKKADWRGLGVEDESAQISQQQCAALCIGRPARHRS